MEVKSDMVPPPYTHTVNSWLNCISPPKCSSINPKEGNRDQDKNQCLSVAVQLIPQIKMETLQGYENREAKLERGGGRVSSNLEWWGRCWKTEARRWRPKPSQKIRGRDSFRSACLSLFLYFVIINEQIRTVLCKCKSTATEIKPFQMFLALGPHLCFLTEQKLLQFFLSKAWENRT